MQRKIIHIDMDCFYAAVELRERPELVGLPVAVGGRSRRSVLTTANYEARRYGVGSAMPTAMALKRCPSLIILPVRFDAYREESRLIFDIFKDYTDAVQSISLDEAFLDVSGCEVQHGSATLIAREIRQRIALERGLTASAGISVNKFIAKIASDWNKPNGQHVVPPEDVDAFVRGLQVEKIWGVGAKTAERLHTLGMRTCADVQRLEKEQLVRHFGKFGLQLYDLSRGVDHRPVNSERRRKSFSIERTTEDDFSHDRCVTEFDGLLRQLFESLERFMARGEGYRIKTAVVKIKFNDFRSTTVERAWIGPSLSHYHTLLREGLGRSPLEVRLLGAGVKFFDEDQRGDQQLDFLDLLEACSP